MRCSSGLKHSHWSCCVCDLCGFPVTSARSELKQRDVSIIRERRSSSSAYLGPTRANVWNGRGSPVSTQLCLRSAPFLRVLQATEAAQGTSSHVLLGTVSFSLSVEGTDTVCVYEIMSLFPLKSKQAGETMRSYDYEKTRFFIPWVAYQRTRVFI